MVNVSAKQSQARSKRYDKIATMEFRNSEPILDKVKIYECDF